MKTKENLYKYIERNLLDNPEYYMFSRFGGTNFFEDYISSRNSCLDYYEKILNHPYSKADAISIISNNDTIELRAIYELDKESRIETRDLLMATLLLSLRNDTSKAGLCFQWLSFFIKRFEVTKRLYTAYSINTKPAASDYRSASNYILLSLSLILFYEKHDNLKMLNCALKLNDLICSMCQDINITRIEDIYLAILSLRSEIEQIKRLALKNRVEL